MGKIIDEGLGEIEGMGKRRFRMNPFKLQRKLRKKVLSRKNVAFGGRVGAAYFTGGQSEMMRARMQNGGGNFISPEQYAMSGIEGDLEGMGKRRGFRRITRSVNMGEIDGMEGMGRRRGFRRITRSVNMGEIDGMEGMGRRRGFRRITRSVSRVAKKAASAPKIVKKLANVKTMLKTASGGLLDEGALKDIGGGLLDTAKGFMPKGKGGGGDSGSQAEEAPKQGGMFSFFGGSGGGGVTSMLPDAMTEEVEEKDEKTGKMEKVKKLKPVAKYSLIGGGVALVGLLAYFIKKRK